MVELFEQNERRNDRQSSKGNQLKWEKDGIWYKADYTGYEGLAEYIVSHLLQKSTLKQQEFVLYDLEEIRYKTAMYTGVQSIDLSEELYGNNIKFYFTKNDVTELLEHATQYSQEIRNRVQDIIFCQMDKYQYLFRKIGESSC